MQIRFYSLTLASSCLVACLGFTVPVWGASITIGPIDAGATLTVNGSAAVENDVLNFADGETVTFVTTFNAQAFEDVIESHYDINVAIHAVDYAVHPGATINLDTDLGYTAYDIFIITSADANTFFFDMNSPPADDALGSSSHTGTPRHLAEVFYGTVESGGNLEVATTCRSLAGSSFNKLVATQVKFVTGCSDDQDIMIQELYADYAETTDTGSPGGGWS